jgi:hypothetical protein
LLYAVMRELGLLLYKKVWKEWTGKGNEWMGEEEMEEGGGGRGWMRVDETRKDWKGRCFIEQQLSIWSIAKYVQLITLERRCLVH